jgi:hypothetical protein
MSRLRRFERIEKERPEGAAAPAAPPSVAGRFAPAPEGPRVLDLSGGQPFVRCARCRGDSHATSATCGHCGETLDTEEQRAFNRAFWLQRQQEDAEQRAAVERLRTTREQAEKDAAEARRHLEWMDQEIALRRSRRLTRRGGELVIDFGPELRPLGLAVGRFLRRAVLAVRARWRDRGR